MITLQLYEVSSFMYNHYLEISLAATVSLYILVIYEPPSLPRYIRKSSFLRHFFAPYFPHCQLKPS